MPGIALAGLTASEATRRLSADPGLRDYTVKVSRCCALSWPRGKRQLKPFGYERVVQRAAGARSHRYRMCRLRIDYTCGPGDTGGGSFMATNPRSTNLDRPKRDGRITFPKLGPIMVSNMNFDAARAVAIERRVSDQLVGSRASVTMDDLRSIRVFVMGEAENPGSHTVSGSLEYMTNALFRQRRSEEDLVAAQHRAQAQTAAWSRLWTCAIFCSTAIPATRPAALAGRCNFHSAHCADDGVGIRRGQTPRDL